MLSARRTSLNVYGSPSAGDASRSEQAPLTISLQGSAPSVIRQSRSKTSDLSLSRKPLVYGSKKQKVFPDIEGTHLFANDSRSLISLRTLNLTASMILASFELHSKKRGDYFVTTSAREIEASRCVLSVAAASRYVDLRSAKDIKNYGCFLIPFNARTTCCGGTPTSRSRLAMSLKLSP